MFVVRRELARAFDAGVVGAVDAVEAIVGRAATLALIVATNFTGAAPVMTGAGFTAPAAFAAAVGVLLALDVFLAAHGRITGVAGVAAARRIEAAPFDAGVDGAHDAVAAVARGAARAAGCTLGPSAAFLAVAAARCLAALAVGADADRARVLVAVAVLIRAALVGAAAVRAAQLAGVAERVCAQRSFASIGGARIAIVAGLGPVSAARFLVDTVSDRRAVLTGAAASRARLMLTGAGEADVVRAAHAVIAIGAFATLTAVAFATLLAGPTLGRELTHAVLGANVLGARITVAAVFRTVAAREDATGAAGLSGAALAALRRAGAAGAAPHHLVARELRAAAAGRGLQGERDDARGHES